MQHEIVRSEPARRVPDAQRLGATATRDGVTLTRDGVPLGVLSADQAIAFGLLLQKRGKQVRQGKVS